MKKDFIISQKQDRSKTIPILTFPAVQLLDISVKDLISSSINQIAALEKLSNFPVSAVVTCMDLSIEAEAFGANIKFFDDEVPTVIGQFIKTADDVFNLKIPQIGLKRERLVLETVKEASKVINRPVFAGAIGPFSLAGRLMDISEIMMNCYDEPDLVHQLLRKVSTYLLNYITELKKAGARGILLAEPVAGLLSPALCEEFSSRYIKDLCKQVKDDNFIFMYHNCGNVIALSKSIIDIDADIYHFGNAIDIEEMFKVFPNNKIVMGNIDPLLFKTGTIDNIRNETNKLLQRCNKYDNFVISSGCDIPPSAKWENINAYFDEIRKFYRN